MKFSTELKTNMDDNNLIILRNLYSPVIGIHAVSLYQLLIDYNNFSQNGISFFSFKDIQNTLGINEVEVVQARRKLEAVGLIRTYEKADNKHQIITINSPISVANFKKNKLLFNNCIKVIGDESFERVQYLMKNRILNKEEFYEVSVKFQDLFEIDDIEKKKQLITDEMISPTIESVSDAIIGLPPSQFAYFLTKRKSPHSLVANILHMQNIGLSESSINEIINYSFNVNGKIVANHILVIANDLFKKDKITHQEIKDELLAAIHSKITANSDEDKQITESSGEILEWDDLFDSLGEL
ncbi:hypothetical protein [Candidatus Mycoplasma mahonii]|uniref:hypothetical protein n=1 Tax=Candidatus Mycoplasma mahonii TaxID=3004105 RepID=UPI0026E9AE94|nr:hypothetical protein [Candidatus Mycoplasma mahonii]WKX02699.1 hypothetical protein O3I44_01325 [Candidatus Mycoplasma mahonii]